MGVLMLCRLLRISILLSVAASRAANAFFFFCQPINNMKVAAAARTTATATGRSRAATATAKAEVATLHMTSDGDSGLTNYGTATTRGGVLQVMGAAFAGTLAVQVAPCPAAATRTTTELVGLLKDARKQLDPADKMIDEAKWDAIRNIIKTSPLADVKNVIAELAKQADDDDSALLLGLRQDVLDHVQYLDSFSYNNVFVGEERQILGTKIDFDTPRMELRQAREAFDIILEVLPAADE